jgi:uncharacterized membrane protein
MIDVASFITALFYVLSFFQWLLTITGVIIIIRGGWRAARIFFSNCMSQGRACLEEEQDEMRKVLGLAIIIGLEFILAGDVIATVVLPNYYHLGLLAILVVIRTVLNYFLDKDLRELSKKKY